MKMLQDRGALPKEERDIVKEYKAMHEKILSNWLREMWKAQIETKTKRKRLERKKVGVVKERWREKTRKRCLTEGWCFELQ